MIRRIFFAAAVCVAVVGALPFGKKDEDDPKKNVKKLSKGLRDFDPAAQMNELMRNPEMVAEMQAMMKDPSTMKEVQELMSDPSFKKKIESFQESSQFDNAKAAFSTLMSDPHAAHKMRAASGDASALNAMGGAGALGAGGARASAADRARMEMEYEKYKQQFTGKQSAQKGLDMMKAAAHDPSMLMDSLNALKDPAMMAEVQEMMQDPEFKAEMARVMNDPAMQDAMKASKEYVEELAKDPKKMKQVEAQMQGLLGAQQ